MSGHTVILSGEKNRSIAQRLIHMAPVNAVLNIREGTRTGEQNAKMWAMLSDVARAKPEGRRWTTEAWKAAFMHSLGHKCMFAEGLDDSGPFPIGFRTSKLTKQQMADLITCIYEYGDRHGVEWSEPKS